MRIEEVCRVSRADPTDRCAAYRWSNDWHWHDTDMTRVLTDVIAAYVPSSQKSRHFMPSLLPC